MAVLFFFLNLLVQYMKWDSGFLWCSAKKISKNS